MIGKRLLTTTAFRQAEQTLAEFGVRFSAFLCLLLVAPKLGSSYLRRSSMWSKESAG